MSGRAFVFRWSVVAGLYFGIFTVYGLAAEEPDADAQILHVLLSGDPRAPTPEQVVEAVEEGRESPLQGLRAIAPERAGYAWPGRAEGDAARWLRENPDTTRAILGRYIVLSYAHEIDPQRVVDALRADPFVVTVYVPKPARLSSAELIEFGVGFEPFGSTDTQYGREALNIDAAWALASGYALVGVPDTGLKMDHPALRQFAANGTYLGGNFNPASSTDIGIAQLFSGWRPNVVPDYNVDELQPEPMKPGGPCDRGDGFGVVERTGHGTHVSGLLAARGGATTPSVQGTCKHCGIAMWRIAYFHCLNGVVTLSTNRTAIHGSIGALTEQSAQVINMSLGFDSTEFGNDYCIGTAHANELICRALAFAEERDVVMVASSGNDRQDLDFPASDPRVIGVGGFDENLLLWDESPGGGTANCPFDGTPTPDVECGSNYTVTPTAGQQELVASAHDALSTTYNGIDWVPEVRCGDSFGPLGGGIGWCTGTSMSAPQIAGIAGILRSVNPLVPAGTPDPAAGVRGVLASTTMQAQAHIPWNNKFGYGIPDAAAAVRRMLGKVAGTTPKNRVTPLFRLHSVGGKDYATTTSPQLAIALAVDAASSYVTEGESIRGYTAFPMPQGGATKWPVPKAHAYVLTTEYAPQPGYPPLVPLHLMDKARDDPTGCRLYFWYCKRDLMLVTSDAHVKVAHDAGYNLRNIQGYIYQRCTPESACIPPGAQKFYRACKLQNPGAFYDCANFIEDEKQAFDTAGYTLPFPGTGTDTVLGYAYPLAHSDADDLIDGFEYVIGTNPANEDSDGDGASDSVEYPVASVPSGDPLTIDLIFENGFD